MERNYNVIVGQSYTNQANQVATDPTTGNAYIVEQVNSAAVGATPDGTTSNPFSSVAQAQAAWKCHPGSRDSVLTSPIVLTPGQHLFGQGNFAESLTTTGGGNVPIPNLLQAGQQSPIIQSVTGSGVTLASNSEVAGSPSQVRWEMGLPETVSRAFRCMI